MLHNQLIADILQKHGFISKHHIDRVKKYFHDNHEQFLQDDFLKNLRHKLIVMPIQWHLNKRAMHHDDVTEPVSPDYSAVRLANLR